MSDNNRSYRDQGPLDERQILNMIGHELAASAGGNENDFIDANRQHALAAYLGQPNGKEQEGRSAVTSTDVADAIEWIMPEIVKAFTQNNEVVTFDATGAEDELQAELESQYVYDILMKENNGFLIIHQLVKDALMQKNGFIKCFYDSQVEVTNETYTGLSEVELNMVLSQPNIELKEVSEFEINGVPVYDVKVARTEDCSKISVISVPPEEFRVNKQHNSIDLADARFSAHVRLTTAGELVEEGFSMEFVDSIPSAQVYEDDREYRFYMQDETVYPDRDVSLDPSQRILEVSECYMNMDVDKDGMAEYVKITVAGGDNPDVLLSMEEIECNPFLSGTCILMSHKLFGLSIYDRLKQIQDQKTTLWRNIFDNMYLQNNQRTVVLEGQVNIDDVMISRPGGIIRAKTRDAVMPYNTPPLPSDAYRMMDYLDQVRAGRSGVTPEGPIKDTLIGDRVGSEGVQDMMSQREELVGLMIRVIAETCIKPLCCMIRDLAVKHQDTIKQYKFRGQWVPVNPSLWNKRKTSTVRVGTGSGNRKQQQAAITSIMAMQEKILANPKQSLVQDQQVYDAANDFAKFAGLASVGKYLIDPASPQGQQFKQQVEQGAQQQQQLEIQKEKELLDVQKRIAAAEGDKAQAQIMNTQLKAENESIRNELQLVKQRSDNEIAHLRQRLDEMKARGDYVHKNKELDFKYYQVDEQIKVQEKQIAASKQNGRKDEAGD